MKKLQPVAQKPEPSYPSRRAVQGSSATTAVARAIAVASASAALLLGACGGCDDPIDETRLPGEAPVAMPDPPKPDVYDPFWYSWIPDPKPVTPPEPVRLAGIARDPFID